MQITSHRPKLVCYTILALGMIGSVITFNTGILSLAVLFEAKNRLVGPGGD